MTKGPNELEIAIIKRDHISLQEVRRLIADAKEHIMEYDDVQDFMEDWFGLEPDYFMYIF